MPLYVRAGNLLAVGEEYHTLVYALPCAVLGRIGNPLYGHIQCTAFTINKHA
jgi:hypothetical protein